MVKALTDSVVRTLKAEKGATHWREVSDGGCRGLRLRISPTGEKVWAIKVTVGLERVRHTIGSYPAISLTDARERTRAYLAMAKDGASPSEMDARQRAEKMTVIHAHADYLEVMRPALRPATVRLKETMFRDHIGPAIGSRLIRTVRKADVVDVVGGVTAKGFAVQANRVFSEIMALLRWCERKGYLDAVPAATKKEVRAATGGAKELPRRRTLTDSEIAGAWRSTSDLGDLTGDFLRLLLLLGQRRDEVRLMTWEEVDMENALWTIPGDRYKTGIAQCVPLSKPAMAILQRRHEAGGKGFVLAGRSEGQAFNGAVSALRRLRASLGKDDFTLHDFRRTVRTGLARLGVDEVTAELVLGHVPQGIAKVYDQHDRLEEQREALQRWADYVERLGMPNANVVTIRRA